MTCRLSNWNENRAEKRSFRAAEGSSASPDGASSDDDAVAADAVAFVGVTLVASVAGSNSRWSCAVIGVVGFRGPDIEAEGGRRDDLGDDQLDDRTTVRRLGQQQRGTPHAVDRQTTARRQDRERNSIPQAGTS